MVHHTNILISHWRLGSDAIIHTAMAEWDHRQQRRDYRVDLTACWNVQEAVVHRSCVEGMSRGMVVPGTYTATGAVTWSSGSGVNQGNLHTCRKAKYQNNKSYLPPCVMPPASERG